jgi:ABC-2 type transport system permease protein
MGPRMRVNLPGRLWTLAAFEFAKSCRMMVRYPTSSIVSIIVMTVVFIGLFETATGIFGNQFASSVDIDLTIQKFILWTTMIMGFASVSSSIRDDTLSGMIETVWMGTLPPAVTITIRGLATICVTLALNIVLAFAIALLYGRLSIFTPDFAMSALLVSTASLGVGLMLGGAVVVFKEIGPALNLLQFVMLPLFMNDARYQGGVVEVLAPGLFALRHVTGASNPEAGLLLSVLWLAIGFCTLSAAVWRSRRAALVYQY